MAVTRESINDLKIAGLGMVCGEQRSGLMCPFCGGGHTRESSLSIKRDISSLVYMCHRNSCGKKGSLPMIQAIQAASTQLDAIANRFSELHIRRSLMEDFEFVALPDVARIYLKQAYGLSDPEITRARLMWIANKRRLWCPIYSLGKYYVGGVSRLLDRSRAKTEPKALTCIINSTYGSTAFYTRDNENDKEEMWLVEDQYSAIRLSTTVNAGALLGTNVNESLIESLLKHRVRRVVLCLDKDASKKSAVIQQKFGQLFDSFRIIFPEMDIKNMSEKELDNLIYLG